MQQVIAPAAPFISLSTTSKAVPTAGAAFLFERLHSVSPPITLRTPTADTHLPAPSMETDRDESDEPGVLCRRQPSGPDERNRSSHPRHTRGLHGPPADRTNRE